MLVEDREGELDEGTGGAVLVELTGVVFEEGTGAVAGASDVLAAALLTEAEAALGSLIGLKKRYITQQVVSHFR